MDAAKVGKAIKTLRLRAGYTQHGLADCLGVTDKAVSKWERGLSMPDISIITKLSVLLNVDVDNLLEGNITYLEKTWQGLFILSPYESIFAGSDVYGKPLVYIFLSYFLLAGVGKIFISCSQRDQKYILEQLGNGSRYGISLSFLPQGTHLPPAAGNTMVVHSNPFVYGPNLTKYFQRAMSRSNGISILTANKAVGRREIPVVFDHLRAVQTGGLEADSRVQQFFVPVLFVPKRFFDQLEHIEDVTMLEPLYAEPMGNGMIEYCISDEDSLWDTASFLRFLRKQMGKDIYDLETVAKNRGFLHAL